MEEIERGRVRGCKERCQQREGNENGEQGKSDESKGLAAQCGGERRTGERWQGGGRVGGRRRQSENPGSVLI
jgi:hypothetical protein